MHKADNRRCCLDLHSCPGNPQIILVELYLYQPFVAGTVPTQAQCIPHPITFHLLINTLSNFESFNAVGGDQVLLSCGEEVSTMSLHCFNEQPCTVGAPFSRNG
jgi:hypothetical protein